MELKRRLNQYVNYIRRKKETRLSLFYAVFYFVFMTLLLVFGSLSGRTAHTIKAVQKQNQVQPAMHEKTTTDIAVDSW